MPIHPEDLLTGGALQGAVADSLLRQREEMTLLAAGEQIGSYRILRELGRGGMAVVYLAARADGEYRQQVALKWMQGRSLDATAEALFRRERQALADLRHPHIARLLDGGRSASGRPWFAMEYIEGLPLDRHAFERGLSLRDRIRLMLQVCEALAFAHGRGILHRDIKPSNVLVDGEGRVRLLDFGIAQALGQDDELAQAAFTPGFASPEQQRGERLSVASDVYQLGRLLDCLMQPCSSAERRPFAADLRAVVDCACADHPQRRYASAMALADDLQRMMQRRPLAARARRPGYLALRFVQRHPLSVGLAVAAAGLLLTAGLLFTWRLAIERDRARVAADRALAGQDFLVSMFRSADPANPAAGPPGTAALLDRGLTQVDAQVAAPAHVRAHLLEILARVGLSLADYDRAQALLDRAFAEPVEATHRLPLWTLQLSLLQRRGSTARAVELAPAILREVPEGAGFDALRARALNTAARAAAQSGDARAAEWLAAALASAERAGDLGQQGYGLRTRAFLRELEGDRAGALIAVESALTTLAAVRDAQAPELFSVRSHRVHLLLAVGRRAEALVEAEAISAAAASLRKEHPAAIYTEVIRALALLNNGRKDEALVLAGVTAERCLSSLGALHAHCGSALHVQGRALVELARAGEALPILREALANREATMGAAHPYSAQVRGLLARAMCAAGEGEAASLHATVGSDEDVPRTMTACGGLDAGEGAAVADGE